MSKHNPVNERVKHKYFIFLREARQQTEASVDAAAKALNRFEVYTSYCDFKKFSSNQAVGFKHHLAKQIGARSGERLSKSTLLATLSQLKRFFQWLSLQPGYKSRIHYTDAEFFNLLENDVRVARAKRQRRVPTIEQVKHVITSMPLDGEIARRNRALIAFTLLTGARDSAIASMKLKHVDLIQGCVDQDAREVKTKFSKTFVTYFFPLGDDIVAIVTDWVAYLRKELLWGNDDPLFPATQIEVGASQQFEATGLARQHWRTTTPIRKIFRDAFTAAGLQYFNPHSFRSTLVRYGEQLCMTPEQFKAWSQNLGHDQVLTTFTSYGVVACQRQGEIIRNLSVPEKATQTNVNEIAEAVFRRFRENGDL